MVWGKKRNWAKLQSNDFDHFFAVISGQQEMRELTFISCSISSLRLAVSQAISLTANACLVRLSMHLFTSENDPWPNISLTSYWQTNSISHVIPIHLFTSRVKSSESPLTSIPENEINATLKPETY